MIKFIAGFVGGVVLLYVLVLGCTWFVLLEFAPNPTTDWDTFGRLLFSVFAVLFGMAGGIAAVKYDD